VVVVVVVAIILARIELYSPYCGFYQSLQANSGLGYFLFYPFKIFQNLNCAIMLSSDDKAAIRDTLNQQIPAACTG
jgi:hypothetical protein